jgi:hypothetical protein
VRFRDACTCEGGEVEPRGCGESAGLTGRCGGASMCFIYPRVGIADLKRHTARPVKKIEFVRSICI